MSVLEIQMLWRQALSLYVYTDSQTQSLLALRRKRQNPATTSISSGVAVEEEGGRMSE